MGGTLLLTMLPTLGVRSAAAVAMALMLSCWVFGRKILGLQFVCSDRLLLVLTDYFDARYLAPFPFITASLARNVRNSPFIPIVTKKFCYNKY